MLMDSLFRLEWLVLVYSITQWHYVRRGRSESGACHDEEEGHGKSIYSWILY